jgi:pseudolysin
LRHCVRHAIVAAHFVSISRPIPFQTSKFFKTTHTVLQKQWHNHIRTDMIFSNNKESAVIYKFMAILILALVSVSAQAAVEIKLEEQSKTLQSFVTNNSNLQETSRHTDSNGVTHIRVQQQYAGIPVWGADAVIHVPPTPAKLTAKTPAASRMNGTLYTGLEKDLMLQPLAATSQDRILTEAVRIYHASAGNNAAINNPQITRLVYVDDNKKAHWAYQVSFLVELPHLAPAKPTYIVDALTLSIYQKWDDIKTQYLSDGGGYGGNKKIGMLTYDGAAKDLPKLKITRDASNQNCLLMNEDVTVRNAKKKSAVISFNCKQVDTTHNSVYWDAAQDAYHGAYSPANDALYVGSTIKALYNDWYGLPVLMRKGKPMMLYMSIHEDMENAYWDGFQMVFGDGGDYFYPLVSLGVGAHEVSHGFTEQHSNLLYLSESGGLNESFSDMAAQAAEFYVNGKSSWQIGAEIIRAETGALRYMDEPKRDCDASQPDEPCSIDNVKDFHPTMNVHFSSGIFNKAFYLLATSRNWDTHKAFDVMVKANMDYWVPQTTFIAAACGVMQAAKDLKYSAPELITAFNKVGISTRSCR